jgi:hypothetical protein
MDSSPAASKAELLFFGTSQISKRRRGNSGLDGDTPPLPAQSRCAVFSIMAPTRLPLGTRWSLDRSTDPGGLFFFSDADDGSQAGAGGGHALRVSDAEHHSGGCGAVGECRRSGRLAITHSLHSCWPGRVRLGRRAPVVCHGAAVSDSRRAFLSREIAKARGQGCKPGFGAG